MIEHIRTRIEEIKNKIETIEEIRRARDKLMISVENDNVGECIVKFALGIPLSSLLHEAESKVGCLYELNIELRTLEDLLIKCGIKRGN
jgi:hypothetical protein